MKIATMTQEFKGEQEPIFLVFQNDKERLWLIKILQSFNPKEGIRIFMQGPDGDLSTKGFKRAEEIIYNPKGY